TSRTTRASLALRAPSCRKFHSKRAQRVPAIRFSVTRLFGPRLLPGQPLSASCRPSISRLPSLGIFPYATGGCGDGKCEILINRLKPHEELVIAPDAVQRGRQTLKFCGAAWSFAHAKSPAGKDRAPCETAAHGLHKHQVSFPQPTAFEGGVEGERDRGRR